MKIIVSGKAMEGTTTIAALLTKYLSQEFPDVKIEFQDIDLRQKDLDVFVSKYETRDKKLNLDSLVVKTYQEHR